MGDLLLFIFIGIPLLIIGWVVIASLFTALFGIGDWILNFFFKDTGYTGLYLIGWIIMLVTVLFIGSSVVAGVVLFV